MPVYIGNNKYNFSGFSKVFWGNNLVWKANSELTFVPILPTNTTTFPLYLKGFKRWKFTQIMQSTTGIVAQDCEQDVYGNHNFCEIAPVYDVVYADLPDPGVRFGTQNYFNRIYLKDTTKATTWSQWNTYLQTHDVWCLLEDNTDNSLWFAVKASDNTYGYYCPATEEYFKPYGMTGTEIERVEYVEFDGQDCYVNTGVNLTGADSVTIDFLYNKSGANIFGSWRSSNTDVYTLYASTSKSYTRYESSLYRNAAVPINTRLTYRMTPTGNYINDVGADTWTQSDFDSATPCLVGWLNGSSSPHMGGNVYDFSINTKCHLIPVRIGTAYYLFDCLQWSLPAHNGTFNGGEVTEATIPFPIEIPEKILLLTIGNNSSEPEEI